MNVDLTPADLDECTFVTAPGDSILYNEMSLAIEIAKQHHRPGATLDGWWLEFRQRAESDLIDSYQLVCLAKRFEMPVVFTGIAAENADWIAIIHPATGAPIAVHSYDRLAR